jgi:hypothetical protein
MSQVVLDLHGACACTYPDALHPVVLPVIEKLVRVEGEGRRMSQAAGRLRIRSVEEVAEPAQDSLFTVETVPLARLRLEQRIDTPQGLGALVDEEWADDEQSRLFLEATLGS